MRIAVVGPTHPYKGGIAQYTTELAHQLAAGGDEVWLESWSHQYPSLLYPGQLEVSTPERPEFPRTVRKLSWRRPDSWYRCGRRMRGVDLVVLVVGNPFQMLPYLTILAGLGHRTHTRVVAQCHNVLPHERRLVDVALVRSLLSRVDGVLAHSPEQGRQAQELTQRPVVVAHMAPLLVTRSVSDRPRGGPYRRLLFFGMVRPYKGLDLLLRAMVTGPPGVQLRIAGEFWGGAAGTEQLVRELNLGDRVEMRVGYVDTAQVSEVFSEVDALVLPYRSGTASFNAFLAFEHGLPVIGTRVGTMQEDVRDDVNGILCAPGSVAALSAALHRFYADGEPEKLRRNVPSVNPGPAWREYAAALRATATPQAKG